METKDMLYIVTEYAKNGEMFGECSVIFLKILLVKMNVGEIIWSWYSDSVLKYPLSLQTTWPQMAV